MANLEIDTEKSVRKEVIVEGSEEKIRKRWHRFLIHLACTEVAVTGNIGIAPYNQDSKSKIQV